MANQETTWLTKTFFLPPRHALLGSVASLFHGDDTGIMDGRSRKARGAKDPVASHYMLSSRKDLLAKGRQSGENTIAQLPDGRPAIGRASLRSSLFRDEPQASWFRSQDPGSANASSSPEPDLGFLEE